jgi:hypothetical protein
LANYYWSRKCDQAGSAAAPTAFQNAIAESYALIGLPYELVGGRLSLVVSGGFTCRQQLDNIASTHRRIFKLASVFVLEPVFNSIMNTAIKYQYRPLVKAKPSVSSSCSLPPMSTLRLNVP